MDLSQRYKVLRGNDVTLSDIEAVIELDKRSLDAQYFVSAEQDLALYQANRENGVVVKEIATGTVVAYSMILPVHKEIYAQIRAGKFIDTVLTPEMVSKFDHPGDDYYVYFASIVVSPEHRNATVIMLMFEAMVNDYIDLAKRGIFGQSMIADVVTRDGERFCRIIGLEEIGVSDHNSKICELIALPPKFRITTDATKELSDLYQAHYDKLQTRGA